MSLYAQDTSNLFLKKDWWPLLYFSVTESFNKFMKTMPSSPSKTHVVYNIFPDHTMPPTSPLSKHNTCYFTLLAHSDFWIQRSGSPFRSQPRTQNENWRASGNWLRGSDPASPPLSIPKFPSKICLFRVSLFPPAVMPRRSLQALKDLFLWEDFLMPSLL